PSVPTEKSGHLPLSKGRSISPFSNSSNGQQLSIRNKSSPFGPTRSGSGGAKGGLYRFQQPSIQRDVGSGKIGSLVRCQKSDQITVLLGVSDSFHRNLVLQVRFYFAYRNACLFGLVFI